VQTVFERHFRQSLWDNMSAWVTDVLATGAGYQSWKCVFTKIDADNSGVLDAAEMSKALREVPIGPRWIGFLRIRSLSKRDKLLFIQSCCMFLKIRFMLGACWKGL
jgi:hypothetical protein